MIRIQILEDCRIGSRDRRKDELIYVGRAKADQLISLGLARHYSEPEEEKKRRNAEQFGDRDGTNVGTGEP